MIRTIREPNKLYTLTFVGGLKCRGQPLLSGLVDIEFLNIFSSVKHHKVSSVD